MGDYMRGMVKAWKESDRPRLLDEALENKRRRNLECPSTFSGYQQEAMKTALYPDYSVDDGSGPAAPLYPVLGLVGEAGEVAEKVKKVLRGDVPLNRDALVKELGDVLWYVTAIARDIGSSLEEVAQANLDKLRNRNERGVIRGSGDDR